MKSSFRRAFGVCAAVLAVSAGLCTTVATAQDKAPAPKTEVAAAKPLTVGDAAPALQVEAYLKGSPVEKFEKGQVYVVEFWATWCGPCKVSIPHLTELQKKFKDKKVTFIGVDVWEKPYNEKTRAKVEKFVNDQGEKMDYVVAYDGPAQKTDKGFMGAAKQNGIPTAFIVTGDSKIAYIGHPMDEQFEETIQQLVEGKFDLAKASAEHQKKADEEAKAAKEGNKLPPGVQEANDAVEKARGLASSGKLDEAFATLDAAAGKFEPMKKRLPFIKFQMAADAKSTAKMGTLADEVIAASKSGSDAMMLNSIAWPLIDPETNAKPDAATGAVALKLANKAVELTKEKDAAILDTLARAQWVSGDKAKAVETQKKAVAAADEDEMKADLSKTLKEYEGGSK
ncbi:MAG: redoxin family protein [Planctomycetes bacterium]|nr:redoxin family protein [Planctomycetota bacterium]